ncbi:GNAT family N-acetyltransferase [Tianweitania sediminis]|uniref:GNAT family N-acetyltransferase n=1 Tax=Tianweitania sediminis TaxID=1502156 RepID=A0A8J7R579_9HYPH|nr:GNAT family N-acetyltransferase [Tianweitania sediminis]MBP0441136.1 GNAT family N-acetyltransferase [Tianweitania sediminis]
MTQAPTLHTQRLTLRAYRLEDFPAFAAMRSDPAVMAHITGGVRGEEDAWGRFMRNFGFWQVLGFGYWALTDRDTGTYVGHAGFHEMRRDLMPSIRGTLEAGWMMTPAVQGKGVATEAMQAALAWASGTFMDKRITCFIDQDNDASRRVAAKLGFTELAPSTYGGKAVTIFEWTRSSHRPAAGAP